MTDKPTLLFYCQHSMGMGHLVRSFALARALTEHFYVVVLNGGRFPNNFQAPDNIDIIQLVPLGMGADGVLVSRDDDHTLAEAQVQRLAAILDAYHSLRPAVIVLELYPFGRRKFGFELIPLLDAATSDSSGQPHIVCSVRDLLVHGKRHQQRRDNQACDVANRYLDDVLVHADPAFARLEETFQPEHTLCPSVHYTGFVLPPRQRPAAHQRCHRVVVSAGGGIVGGELFRAAIDAQPQLWNSDGLRMTLIAGPFLPEEEWRDLQLRAVGCPGLQLLRSVPDLYDELADAAFSVSQCGYNTAMEILGSGVPALVVPYFEGNENEQMNRARRLEDLDSLRVLHPDQLDGENLAQSIRTLLTFRPAANALSLDGAEYSAQLIWDRMNASWAGQQARSRHA